MLIIPPWISKFYILDLKEEFADQWAVDQGHTVFVISWVNPDESLRHKRFDDYMLEGPLAALDAIQQATGAKGDQRRWRIVSAAPCWPRALAYMAASKRDNRIKAATFMTTLMDFLISASWKCLLTSSRWLS